MKQFYIKKTPNPFIPDFSRWIIVAIHEDGLKEIVYLGLNYQQMKVQLKQNRSGLVATADRNSSFIEGSPYWLIIFPQ